MEARTNIDIKNFLPHREPMLMANVTPYLDETSVETCFKVEASCIFVKNGYLSETGLIENAAQTCATIVGQSFFDDKDKDGNKNKVVGYISAVKKVEVFALPKVGETITTKGELISRYDNEAFSSCTIASETFRNGELIVACTLNFLIHEV
ncbi:ABC transporter permease [Zobellia galactanivorans]|uniref:ABC transporter permease n=1 Tax=Zobellia galactanivorans (strain DSM 12802 / CCUG 47099 / CIP 106680 / NCIMB 13871 / Dsij) TaxID=63186 RepID=UPI0020903660|nr:ABC transporter permease [Zobellia galactanivorans]